MTDKIDDGGKAFPWCGDLNDCPTINLGMSLRDWFAGQALAGILSGGFADTVPHDDVSSGTSESPAAYFAYLYADAMLAARSTK